MDQNNRRTRRQSPKANLIVRYVVRTKDEVEHLHNRFQDFVSRCDLFDTSEELDTLPAIISMDADGKTVNVILDASCEVVIRDLKDVKRLVYRAGCLSCELPLGSVMVHIGEVAGE